MERMKGNRKGFTLVEAVVTLAILGLTFGLTTLAISQLARIQDGATGQVSIESSYQAADEMMTEFVSFVSLKTSGDDGINFAYTSQTESSLTFTAAYHSSSYLFTLSHDSASKSLKVISDPNVPAGYLAKSKWTKASHIEGVNFSFDSDLSLFNATIRLDETHSRNFAYVVRANA